MVQLTLATDFERPVSPSLLIFGKRRLCWCFQLDGGISRYFRPDALIGLIREVLPHLLLLITSHLCLNVIPYIGSFHGSLCNSHLLLCLPMVSQHCVQLLVLHNYDIGLYVVLRTHFFIGRKNWY